MRKCKHPIHIVFNTVPIDTAATRAAVEERLEEVRQYRQIGFIRQEAVITASYEPKFHGPTNAISKPTETIAIRNVDKEAELREKSALLDKAMGNLSSPQREVIERSYLDNEGEYDFISCGEMGISDRTYRRIKASAIQVLAAFMKLEVVEGDEEITREKYEVG
ncbi:ArpU family phage packaging/lysis transcriptional regulator [Paenibacillus segetis]|uniref:ArpU family transcriptional regulator n=1 Tax=Paenibacillus segetis TaxID=1325360 RepID=A0ABQ1YJY5_9BACL|nr:ArpU family phage packaging/lysis transcriptional regulator [Paenibacillus segetis]GGH28616.1 ArpU family transcriptional regulator [Paenibacillus segetis]